ncbi:Eco29kI family restriction endonuclease [Nitratireductor alexandrii]|uniref:Eco29kI family restriction endonuclease n=1 Tax=Nitratireductor alexandrii TaxID=2448161 RepID=UPI000FD9A66F|nr:Eco29kI family restriction endonuclease [Nitratireductor alexandrii]
MAPKPKKHEILLDEMLATLSTLGELGETLSRPAAKKTRESLYSLRDEIAKAAAALDPVREPASWFDPADPYTAGRLVAVALLAQPRVPLDLISRSYGAGVYAIYYKGDHPAYAPISGTETPIYVGKADPSSGTASSPREQGQTLYGRLADHRKAIRIVEQWATGKNLTPPEYPLRIADFECRRLVTATNAQTYAESHLINLFEPVWNRETRICWGISMHGDTDGRNNARPPWHVLHRGVSWAMAEKRLDSRPLAQILDDISKHFNEKPGFASEEEIIDQFLKAFAQDPMIVSTSLADDDPNDAPHGTKKSGI